MPPTVVLQCVVTLQDTEAEVPGMTLRIVSGTFRLVGAKPALSLVGTLYGRPGDGWVTEAVEMDQIGFRSTDAGRVVAALHRAVGGEDELHRIESHSITRYFVVADGPWVMKIIETLKDRSQV